MSLFRIPCKYANLLEKIQKILLYSGSEEHQRFPLISWDNVCLPKHLGGLGIRKLRPFNKALQAKYIWRIFSSKGDCRHIMEDKYLGRPSIRKLFNEDTNPKGAYI